MILTHNIYDYDVVKFKDLVTSNNNNLFHDQIIIFLS